MSSEDSSTVTPKLSDKPVSIIFLDGLPFEHTCLVCQQALRSPVKATCGHYYCKNCLEGYTICTVCSVDISDSKLVVDREKHRQIQQLGVICSFSDHGCEWKGTLNQLETHIKSCNYRVETCTNCCRKFPMILIQDHIKSCSSIIEKCEFCGSRLRATDMNRHLKICKKVLLSCPFNCGIQNQTREEIDLHRKSCPNANDVCPFADFGCTFNGDKLAVQNHLVDEPIRHLMILCDETALVKEGYAYLLDNLVTVLDQAKELENRSYLCEALYGPQMIWRIDEVNNLMNEAKSGARPIIYSNPFVSGRYGYKMIASACLYGDGPIYVCLLRGEFDGILVWPFNMIIKVTLLDQSDDYENRTDFTYSFDPRCIMNSKGHFLDRPISERNAAFGAQAFISLEQLDHYIRDDVMYIKIEMETPATPVISKTRENIVADQTNQSPLNSYNVDETS